MSCAPPRISMSTICVGIVSLSTYHCIVWHSLFSVEERTEGRQRNELCFCFMGRVDGKNNSKSRLVSNTSVLS